MPIYEYKCLACGTEFEKIIKVSDGDKKQTCPNCEASVERQRISQGSFHLKGKWFKTDGQY